MDLVREMGWATEREMVTGILSCMGNSNTLHYRMDCTLLRNRTPT